MSWRQDVLIHINTSLLSLLLGFLGSKPPISNGRRPRPRSLHHRCCHPGCGHHRHSGKLPGHVCVLQVLFFTLASGYEWASFRELVQPQVFVCICDNNMHAFQQWCVYVCLCRSRSLRTPSNIFIINLAITDFFMCLTQTPIFFITSMHKRWIFGKKGNTRKCTVRF